MLQVSDRSRPPHVGFAADPISVIAADLEGVGKNRNVAESRLVALDRFARDLAQADAFDLRMRAGEVAVDEGRAQVRRHRKSARRSKTDRSRCPSSP